MHSRVGECVGVDGPLLSRVGGSMIA
jgi:hypothetical protein